MQSLPSKATPDVELIHKLHHAIKAAFKSKAECVTQRIAVPPHGSWELKVYWLAFDNLRDAAENIASFYT